MKFTSCQQAYLTENMLAHKNLFGIAELEQWQDVILTNKYWVPHFETKKETDELFFFSNAKKYRINILL